MNQMNDSFFLNVSLSQKYTNIVHPLLIPLTRLLMNY